MKLPQHYKNRASAALVVIIFLAAVSSMTLSNSAWVRSVKQEIDLIEKQQKKNLSVRMTQGNGNGSSGVSKRQPN